MGLVVWAIVAGALMGLVAGGGFGFVFGGFSGVALGLWLRAAIRAEMAEAIRAAQSSADFPGHSEPTTREHPASAGHAEPAAPMSFDVPRANEQGLAAEPEARPEPMALSAEQAPAQRARPDIPLERAEEAGAQASSHPLPPDRTSEFVQKARDWLMGGNTIARVGLAVLFLGLVFLARLAVNAGLYPIEARLATVAAAGIALLAVGLRKRVERPPFALLLQGGGVAVLYLVIFAAARVYAVMPPLPAFGFMIVFAALGCALAVMQNAQGMALASFLGGYAVPVLLGGKTDTPLGLFSYITILNVAVLVIAWRKTWRSLNLLGFFATFGLATLWGLTAYEDRHLAMCEGFLIASVAIYLATALLYAHNTPGKLGNYADATLLFGTALGGFGLQAALVHDRPYATAFSALGFAAAYLGTAAFGMRRRLPGMRLLNECLIAIGIGFVTLAVPLAIEAKWVPSTWALEGAGAFWIGARQARWMPRAFGLLIQAAAALIAWAGLGANISSIPIANNGFLVPALIALPVLLTAWQLRLPLPHSGSRWARAYERLEHGLGPAWFLGGFAFVCAAIVQEATRFRPDMEPVWSLHVQQYAITLAILGAMAAGQAAARRAAWAVAAWPSRAGLLLVSGCLMTVVLAGRHVMYWPDAAWWVVILGLFGWTHRHQPVDGWTGAMHTGSVFLLTALVADALYLGIDRGELWDTSWAGVVFLVSATALLAVVTRWTGPAATLEDLAGLGWPRDPYARAYWWHAGLVVAGLVYLGAMFTAVLAEGVADPLPYIPLLNPVDLSVLLALAALAQWRRVLGSARALPEPGQTLRGGAGLAAEAALAFAIVNTIWLRTAHHFLGVGWDAGELAASQIVQSGFSLLWTLMAMALMLFARHRTARLPWLAGATLLAVVVGKLFLLDMSKVDGVARIVAFIGVGVLMLLIGYFVPLPPRRGLPEEAST